MGQNDKPPAQPTPQEDSWKELWLTLTRRQNQNTHSGWGAAATAPNKTKPPTSGPTPEKRNEQKSGKNSIEGVVGINHTDKGMCRSQSETLILPQPLWKTGCETRLTVHTAKQPSDVRWSLHSSGHPTCEDVQHQHRHGVARVWFISGQSCKK